MDERTLALKRKLDQLVREAAEVEVELSRADGTIQGVPHYSVIEGRAHELGRQLSCAVQQRQTGVLAVVKGQRAKCPACGTECELQCARRSMSSIDGPFEAQELKGYCPACRRAFFPSAGSHGF